MPKESKNTASTKTAAPQNMFTLKNMVTIGFVLIALFIFGLSILSPFITPMAIQSKPKLEYKMLAKEHIVSAAYKAYGNEKLGMWVTKMVATNAGDAPLYDLKFQYKIDNYAEWSESIVYPVLLPNSTVVDIYHPLLSAEVAKLTASTPSKINVKITYSETKDGPTKEVTTSKPVTILGAHEIIYSSIPPEENLGTFYDAFDNAALIAAWVTPTDPVLINYADLGNKLAGGAGASLSDEDAIASLAGMWQVSINNNIQYKTEPAAYWTGKFSQYLKYPRDVIKDRAGTCIDTAILFAALAFSQGMKAYIVLVPGHAFPVIELPSGGIVPIESTQLNNHATFEQAVKSGEEQLNKAFAGPHIVIDVQSIWEQGVAPPELETLPADIIEKWGITQSGTSGQGGGGQQGGGQQGGGQQGGGTQPGGTTKYSYPSPAWNLYYPTTWSAKPGAGNVDFYSQTDDLEYFVMWEQGYSAAQMKTSLEAIFNSAGFIFVKTGESTSTVSGVSAQVITYELSINGKYYLGVADYFSNGGYGYVVLCDYPEALGNAGLQKCNGVTQTFALGG